MPNMARATKPRNREWRWNYDEVETQGNHRQGKSQG